MNPIRRRPPSLGLAVWLACALAACGGGGGDETPAATPPNVTAAGGTVASDDGKATLTVPAGAVSAPATVTLTADTGAAPPPEAMIVEGTRYRIGGNGGDLSADAQIALTATQAFPAGLRFRPEARPRTQFYLRTPDAPCDVNGDNVIDELDANLWAQGYTCFEPPRLVDVAQVKALAACVTPQGASISCGVPSLHPQLLGVQFDPVAPTVAVVSFDGPLKPQPVTQPGIYTLEVTATDNFAVARVDFYAISTYRGNVTRAKVSTATSPPYRGSIALSSADNGKVEGFIAEAVDSWGNVTGRGVPLLVDIATPPPADTTPPVVVAQASALVVQVGAPLTITANASDDVGVVKIEFLRNGVLVAESAVQPAALHVPAMSAADLGTIVYTVRALDAAGNVGSKTFNITVAAAAGEAWVDAGTGSDANGGTAAAPFKTLGKAFATVGPNGTVWLVGNTVVTPTSEGLQGDQIFTGLAVPAGVAIKAETADAPTIGVTLAFTAGGQLADVRLDPSTNGRVMASGGVVTLNRVRWAKSGIANLAYGLVVSGNALVTLGAVGQPGFDYVLSGLVNLASVAGSAELTVLDGRIDGVGQQGAFALDGTAKLRLESVKIVRSQGSWMSGDGAIYVGGTGNRLEMVGVTLDLPGSTTACVVQDRQVAAPIVEATIVIQNSVLAHCGGGGLQLREGQSHLTLHNSTVSGSGRYAIEVGQIGFDSGQQYGRADMSIVNSQLSGNILGSVWMNHGGTVGIVSSSLAGGARGVTLLGADKRYQLAPRLSSIAGDSDGFWLQGDATSSFDLGNETQGGGNVFAGGATLVRVSVAAGVTVAAIGNTWKANVQGADAAGTYSTAVCGGANPCEVSAGSGGNYVFDNAGAGSKLRLAGQ